MVQGLLVWDTCFFDFCLLPCACLRCGLCLDNIALNTARLNNGPCQLEPLSPSASINPIINNRSHTSRKEPHPVTRTTRTEASTQKQTTAISSISAPSFLAFTAIPKRFP